MKVRKLGAILLAGALMATPVVTTTAMAESSTEETTQMDYTVTIDGKEADPDNLGYSGIEHTIKITLKKGENDITGAYAYFDTNDLNGLHNCVVDVKYDIPCSIKIAENKTTWSESSGSNWSASSGGVETDENNKVKDVSGDLDFWCDFSMMPYGWNVAGFKTTKDKGEGTASFTLNPDHTKDDPNETINTTWYIRAGIDWTSTDKTEGTIELTVKETKKIKNIEDTTGNLVIDGTTLTGVTEQGKNAKKIIIPDGVKLIIPGAFMDCKATEISIPNSVTHFIAGGFSALSTFEGSNFKSITIPDSMTSICSHAFDCCDKLENITIGKNVTEIEYDAFARCDSLKSVTIPDNVKKVGFEAFVNCTNLENVVIGNGVTSLGVNDINGRVGGLFEGCTNLKTVTIGDSVEGFETDIAFVGCSSLESINVSEKNNHFSSSDGILFNKDKTRLIKYPATKTGTSYTIPDSVTVIDSGAFEYNKNIKSVYIHKNVTEISSYVFGECENLTDVYYGGTQEQLTKALGNYTLENVFNGATIHYNSIMPEETPDTPSSSSSSSSSTTTPESSSSSSSSSSTTTPEGSSSTTTEGKDFSDATTKVEVSVPKTLADGLLKEVTLAVEQVKNTDANDKTVTYDITFKDKDGKVVSLDKNTTEITVKLPIPEALKDEKKLYVYYVDNGKYTDMKATVKDGSLEFKTTHFSKYLITTDGSLESTDKENADTGFGGIAMTLGIVALAGAAIVVAKKNH